MSFAKFPLYRALSAETNQLIEGQLVHSFESQYIIESDYFKYSNGVNPVLTEVIFNSIEKYTGYNCIITKEPIFENDKVLVLTPSSEEKIEAYIRFNGNLLSLFKSKESEEAIELWDDGTFDWTTCENCDFFELVR